MTIPPGATPTCGGGGGGRVAEGRLLSDVRRQLHLWPADLLLLTGLRLVTEVEHHDLLAERHRLWVARVLSQHGRLQGAPLPPAPGAELFAIVVTLRLWRRGNDQLLTPEQVVYVGASITYTSTVLPCYGRMRIQMNSVLVEFEM